MGNVNKRQARREHAASFIRAIGKWRAANRDEILSESHDLADVTALRFTVCVRKRPLFMHEVERGDFDVVTCCPSRAAVCVHDGRMQAGEGLVFSTMPRNARLRLTINSRACAPSAQT